jgi:hypothetical protein
VKNEVRLEGTGFWLITHICFDSQNERGVEMCAASKQERKEIHLIGVKIFTFVSCVKVDFVFQSFGDCLHIHQQGLM